MDNKVFLLHKEVYKYPDKSPFRPSVRYPEYPFSELSKTDESNEIYEMVRESFHLMILSRLVDTFISRISLTMLPVPNPHNTVCVLSGEEARHWQSRSSGYSSS